MSKSKLDESDEEKIAEEIRRKLADPKKSSEFVKQKAARDPSRSIDWRNPEEVKEYLDNLQIEYSFQCLKEKEPEGCLRLANFFENVRSQYKEATDLYKKTCDEYKLARSCFTYSKNKSLGRGCKQDLLEACQYNFISCDYGLTEGCLNAGVCSLDGTGGWPINVRDSLKYFEKACDGKHPAACLKLFSIYINGKGNVQKDGKKALEYAKLACDYGDLYGCFNASRMLRIGDGVPKDSLLSEEYRKRAEKLIQQNEVGRGAKVPIVFGEQHK